MPRKSEWGDRTFKQNNAEDDKVRKELIQKALDLGEHENPTATIATPNEFHKLNPSWQPYSASSFAKTLKTCRAIVSKSSHHSF